jgi:hypothetical protein
MSYAEVLRSIVPRLEQSEIQYMITGSIAAAYYGLARATYDLDIVISATAGNLKRFIELLPQEQYYAALQDALEAHRHHSMFNVLDTASGWKIDFILKKPAPFHQEAFQRRLAVTFDGVPTAVISAEDLILSKLEWAGMGESERQIRDAAVVLEKGRQKLDFPYIERWIAELGLVSQWAEARRRAGLE